MKKKLSILTLAVGLIAAATLTASAGTWTYNSATQTLSHDTTPWVLDVMASGMELTITNVKTRATSLCALPLGDTVSGGYEITAIADADVYASITTGVFSSVGWYIQSLTLPSTLKTIGDAAFYYCRQITGTLTIPSGEIKFCTFESCTGLTGVTLGDNVTTIGGSAFINCTGLTSVVFGNSVTTIDGSAFSQCTGLTNVTIPDSVTNIGNWAFDHCYGLTNVTIGNNVANIGKYAFTGCYGLTNVTIGNNVANIDMYAFAGCQSLTSVTYLGACPAVGKDIFSVSPVTSYVYSANAASWISQLDSGTFEDGNAVWCGRPIRMLTDPVMTVTFDSQGDSVATNMTVMFGTPYGTLQTPTHSDPDYAFAGWFTDPVAGTRITAATIVTATAAHTLWAHWTVIPPPPAFEGTWTYTGSATRGTLTHSTATAWVLNVDCNGTNLTVTGNNNPAAPSELPLADPVDGYAITALGDNAFTVCTNLTAVTLPAGLTSIDALAFYACVNLTAVTFPADLTSIGFGAFSYCTNLTAVTLPVGLTSIGASAFSECFSLTAFIVPAANPAYKAVDDVLFNKAGATLIVYPCKKEGAYAVPAGVTSIDNYAFFKCDGLTALTLPAGLTSIGHCAFMICTNLTGTLTLPTGLSFIGDAAFHSTGLTAVTVPASLTSINTHAFAYCTALTIVIYQGACPAVASKDGHYAESTNVISYVTDAADWPQAQLDTTATLVSGNAVWCGRPIRTLSDTVMTVTFDSQGGNAVTNMTVMFGAPYGTLEPPTHSNPDYAFAGWFTDPMAGTQITATTIVTATAAHTLWAHWTSIPPPPPELSVPTVGVSVGGTVSFSDSPAAFTFTVPGAIPGAFFATDNIAGIKNPKITVKGLPAGVKYNATTGEITGAPTKSGTFTVTVTVKGANKASASQTFTLEVAALPEEAIGAFNGYVIDAANTVGGTFTLTAAKNGKLTAKVVMPSGTQSFSVKAWDSVSDGTFSATLTNAKDAAFNLTSDTTVGAGALGVSGTFMADGVAYNVVGQKTEAASIATYTVALPVDAIMAEGTAQNAPFGDGYLTISVNAKGVAKLAGLAADGATKLTGSVAMLHVGSDWMIPAVFKINSGKGYFGGLLTVGVDGKIIGADWHWLNPGQTSGADNFTLSLAPFGSAYTTTDAAKYNGLMFRAEPPVDPTLWTGIWQHMPNVMITENAGKLSLPKGKAPTKIGAFDTASGNPAVATLKLTAKSGIVKGKFNTYLTPDGGATFTQTSVTWAGVLLPAHNCGRGSYLIPRQAGPLKVKQSYQVVIE